MFENSGTKVKDIAFWVFVINAVFFVVLGVSIMESNALLAFILIGVGICVSYASSLLLIAFGDMVESNAQLVKINEQILERLEKAENSNTTKMTDANSIVQPKSGDPKSAQAFSKTPTVTATKKSEQNTPLPANSNNIAIKIDRSLTMVSCPKCGTVQRSNRLCCFKCGIAFETE